MSPTFETRFRLTAIMLFSALTLFGVWLRLWQLSAVPFGLDSDQAKVLFWGLESLENARFRVYADEATHFEALSTYLFALSEKFLGEARYLSAALSILDLALLGILLRRRKMNWESTLAAVALLACAPFAIFYGRVAGPCVGASTILLLFFLLPASWGRVSTLTLGLFYYSIFRLLWIYELVASAIRRDRSRFLRGLVPMVILVAVSWVSVEVSSDTKFRGLYNFNLQPSELFTRIGEGMGLWLWAPSDRMVSPTDALVIDPVSQGFAWTLSTAPAMGFGFSLLLVLALIQFGQDFFGASRKDGIKNTLLALPPELKFCLFAAAALCLSPTYSHAIFLVPLVAYFVVYAFQNVSLRHQGVKWAMMLAVLFSGTTGLMQANRMLQNLNQPGEFDQVFSDRIHSLFAKRIPEIQEGPIVYFSAQQFYQARYWAKHYHSKVQILPALPLEKALEHLRLQVPRGEKLVVYFDAQELNLHWAQRPQVQKQLADLAALEAAIHTDATLVHKEEILEWGKPSARRYVILWTH